MDGMNERQWADVDEYIQRTLLGDDPALEAALAESAAAGLPPISVSPAQGKMLELLARLCCADRILEIGTLGGYSTIALARALPPNGRLVTLELERKHAEVARKNLDRAGVGERVEIRVGPASESLAAMVRSGEPVFDFVFLDADKGGYPAYLQAVRPLLRPGSVIVADNVVRDGAVAEPSGDESVRGAQRFNAMLGSDAGYDATVIQTVGLKGYDGFALALVS